MQPCCRILVLKLYLQPRFTLHYTTIMHEIKKLDLIGMSASIVCAAHCSILPLAITYGLLGGSFMVGHGIFELLFIGVSVYLAVSSLYSSYRNFHKNILPIALFVLGLFSISLGLILHAGWEILLATLGGLVIATAHFLNYRLNHILAKSKA